MPTPLTWALAATSVLALACTGTDADPIRDMTTPIAPDASPDVASTTPRGPALLIDHEAWQPLEAGDDPFDDRPDTVDCPQGGFRIESSPSQSAMEVDTGICNYFGVSQPTLVDLRAGDVIEFNLLHLTLFTGEEAEAHVALIVGDELLWDKRIPIPSPAGVYREFFTITGDWPAGTPVIYHLHNHGANNWRLFLLERQPPEN